MRLLLLTLEKHKDGIWITRLLREFQQRIDSKVAVVTVEVVVLEQIGHEVVLVDATATAAVPTFLQHYDGIINRVSDAADPVMVKRCGAILNVARHLLHIPVFNGPTAYALCANKWCHHVLFHLAKLRAPSTAMIYVSQYNPTGNDDGGDGDDTTRKESLFDTSRRLLPSHNDPPVVAQQYLIKPNAGGFGNGIVKLNDHHHHNDQNINTEMTTLLPAVNDDTLLLQAYCGGGGSNSTTTVTFYRVWFLLGKVQCAVQRRILTPDTTFATGSTTMANDTATATTTNAHEFTTGCSAHILHTTESDSSTAATLATTTTTTTTTLPWAVPEDVRIEIEEQLLPLLPEDGHAGSVEFLTMTTSPRDNPEKDHSPDRYYFDLNLLSTLPIVGGDDDDDKKSTSSDVWGVHYNPWSELAQGIVSVMLKRTT